MDVKKVAIKIWQPIVKKLNDKMEQGCLRRDAYINKILAIELEMMDQEIMQLNSEEAREFIAASLNGIPRQVVTFSLRVDVIDRLDEICNRKNMVRDAILNRIFLILILKPEHIERLLGLDAGWQGRIWNKHAGDFGFFPNIYFPLEPDIDPFRVIREGIRLRNEDTDDTSNIYSTIWAEGIFKNVDLTGMNCYLPNHYVKDSSEYLEFIEGL
ncbi:conserved hypothetical protein [Candidatus Nitrotoga sp. BS]|uniref:hypothetical protein n=1 Tax=Candidatus Nitrotoga sp. BS TaxID=2890408 RepID=UPI001EF38BC1|nr:hypothetical protein [Candidatus Nitrotoga sp. BS]CAH1204067.1 conserved hypothetical protein [Candidatus Nitrotoga sp. BS]